MHCFRIPSGAATRRALSVVLLVASSIARTASAGTAGDGGSSAVESSVVKVFSTMLQPDPFKPWAKQPPQQATASGVVVAGHRILTNAHAVLYATEVQVQANQSGDKIPATVEAVAPGIDLALLKLEDDSFFDTHRPLERATALPSVKDVVLAYGYPTGGASLSITKGIVSRIEFASYNFPVRGLRIQIDAAINPGNSGGPAVVDDRMIGLAFSYLGGAQDIGYIIPNEEIELFLADVADGKYDGKPMMFDDLQTLENPALRDFLKLDKGVEGVVVREPFSRARGYPLEQWDVISRIGDTPIDDEGMVKLGSTLRVQFPYLIQHMARGGRVPLTIVRRGKTRSVELPVSPTRPMLVRDLDGTYPPYFICGPLVFSVATTQFLGGFVTEAKSALPYLSYTGSPLATRMGEGPAFPGEELVIVSSPLFPSRLSRGYDNPIAEVVQSVNGVRIKNLRHLVEVLRDSHDEFVTIEFARHESEALVFRRKDLLASTDQILADNGIRSQGSPDTMAVWSRKTATADVR